MEWYLVQLHARSDSRGDFPLARQFLLAPEKAQADFGAFRDDVDYCVAHLAPFQTTATLEQERWIVYNPEAHWLKVVRLGKGEWRGSYLANAETHERFLRKAQDGEVFYPCAEGRHMDCTVTYETYVDGVTRKIHVCTCDCHTLDLDADANLETAK